MPSPDWDGYFGTPAGQTTAVSAGPAPDWDGYFGPAPTGAAQVASPAGQSVSSAPPQDTSWLRYPEMAGQAVVRGLSQAAALPGNVLSALGVPQLTPEQQADVGWAAGEPATTFPTSAQLSAQLGSAQGDARHLVGQGPYPEAERLGAAGIEALGANAPYVMAGGGAGLAARLAMTEGSGVAGELAHEYAPNVPGGPAAAGALVGGLGQLGRNLAAGSPIERIAAGLGSSATPEEAGTTLQQWAKGFRDPSNPTGMDNQIGNAKAQLDTVVPPGTPVPPSQLVANANELIARGGKGANAVRQFLTSTVKSGGDRGTAAGVVQGNLAAGGALTGASAALAPLDWTASSGLRSELGAAYRSSRDPTEQAALKFLYSGHTDDLGQAAAGVGAGDQFQAYNKFSTDLHSLNEGPVDSLLSANPGPAAVSMINQAKKGGTDLAALRAAGAPVDELSAATLRSNPGVWKNLSPEGKSALVQDPDQLATLDRFARPPSKLAKIGNTAGHFIIGEGLGTGAAYLLGHGTPGAEYLGNALGGLAGIATPYLLKGGASMVRPNMLGAELAGANAGTAGASTNKLPGQ